MSWIIVFFVLFWCFYKIKIWIYDCCCDPLSYVVITGNRCFTTNDDINNAITQFGELGTLITQDVNVIQKKIEQLPWVKRVSVRKKWPDTLKIHLIEYIPIAYWNDNLIISTTGIIVKASNFQSIKKNKDNDTACVPTLYGPDNKSKDILNHYLIFREILRSNTLQIKSAKMDIRCSWQLVLTGGIYLKLGKENIIERLRYFLKIYPILIQKIHEQNKHIDYIDLRYRSGFVVKWINNTIITTPVTFSMNEQCK